MRYARAATSRPFGPGTAPQQAPSRLVASANIGWRPRDARGRCSRTKPRAAGLARPAEFREERDPGTNAVGDYRRRWHPKSSNPQSRPPDARTDIRAFYPSPREAWFSPRKRKQSSRWASFPASIIVAAGQHPRERATDQSPARTVAAHPFVLEEHCIRHRRRAAAFCVRQPKRWTTPSLKSRSDPRRSSHLG